MRNLRFNKAIISLVGVSILLSGCGNSAASGGYAYEAPSYEESYYYEEPLEEVYYSDDVYEDNGAAMKMESSSKEADPSENLEANKANRKLIKTVNLSAQTKEFDKLIQTVTSRIDELGGYAETLDVSGYEYNARSTSVRSAYIVARIPSNKLNLFVNTVTENSNITSKNESVSDVTLEYTDVEAHRNSLRVEQKRLDELLGQADSIETIIALESRLSEVRYELESYESRLRSIDNRVDYSTVYLNVIEVKDYTPIVTEEKSFVQRLTEGFSEGCENALDGLKDFVIGFVTVLPGLIVFVIILAIIVVILFFVVKLIVKLLKKITKADVKSKLKSKKNKEEAKITQTNQIEAGDKNDAK